MCSVVLGNFFFPKVIQILPILEEMLECFSTFKFFKMSFICCTHTKKNTLLITRNYIGPLCQALIIYLHSVFVFLPWNSNLFSRQRDGGGVGAYLSSLPFFCLQLSAVLVQIKPLIRFIASTDILILHAPGSQLSCWGCCRTGLFPLVVITLITLQ